MHACGWKAVPQTGKGEPGRLVGQAGWRSFSGDSRQEGPTRDVLPDQAVDLLPDVGGLVADGHAGDACEGKTWRAWTSTVHQLYCWSASLASSRPSPAGQHR